MPHRKAVFILILKGRERFVVMVFCFAFVLMGRLVESFHVDTP